MRFALVTAPTVELFTLDEAKAHLRVDLDVENDLIETYLAAARSHLEEICGRSFITTTWDYFIDDDWPWVMDIDSGLHQRMIEVPKAPLASVTSISYVDGAGATQTLSSANYVVDGAGAIGRIYPAYGVEWPSVRCQPRAITVRFVAGYGAAASFVPKPIKHANLLLLSHFFEQREPVNIGNIVTAIPLSVESLIAPFRVYF